MTADQLETQTLFIPKGQRENITLYRSFMHPYSLNNANIPEELMGFFPVPGKIYTFVTEEELTCWLTYCLIFMHEYMRYQDETGKLEIGSGHRFFLTTRTPELIEAITNRGTGRQLFSQLEKHYRYDLASREGIAVLEILKTAYNRDIRLSVFSKVMFDITRAYINQLDDESSERIRFRALWVAYATWVAPRFTAKYAGSLHTGVYSQEAGRIRDCYVFLAKALVNWCGISKAGTARLLGVQRGSIYNWLKRPISKAMYSGLI